MQYKTVVGDVKIGTVVALADWRVWIVWNGEGLANKAVGAHGSNWIIVTW
jgi:hypothetical protein